MQIEALYGSNTEKHMLFYSSQKFWRNGSWVIELLNCHHQLPA